MSLRDIDRTMIVFKFFYDKLNGALGTLINATRLHVRPHTFAVKVLQLTTNIHNSY